MRRFYRIQLIWLPPHTAPTNTSPCHQTHTHIESLQRERTAWVAVQDTPHAGRDSRELFLSSHVEDCVALAAVLGSCTVLRQQPDQPLPAAPLPGTTPTYVCCYQYNCEDPSALRLLE